MIDLIKRNKLLIIVIALLLIMIIGVSLLGSHHATPQTSESASSHTPIIDNATADNTAESLNALTQELHHVISSNHKLRADNQQFKNKNAHILHNIRHEVQHNLETELHKRGQDNQAKINRLEQQLQAINDKLSHKQQTSSHDVGYAIDNQNAQTTYGRVVHVNGQRLVAMPDISDSGQSAEDNPSHSTSTQHGSATPLHPKGSIHNLNHKQSKAKPKPYYTLPNGATLARSVTMTSLIGRVPVKGVVKSPYPFKMIIGGDNMAANGLHIPGISGAIVQGYAVGDMLLSRVKGYITTITFVFPDGTIDTTQSQGASSHENLGFDNTLGYISQPNGNPFFPGTFYTNAPKYLSTMMALGALNQGGQAYSVAQQTAQNNTNGGTTTSLTGSVGKYMLGGAVQGGTKQAMDWFTQRENNSFDAVYVPPGRKAVINITHQIDINYNPNGRKIYYGHHQNRQNNTSID